MFAPGGTKGLETGKNCLVRSPLMSLLTRYHHGDKVKRMRWAWYMTDMGEKIIAFKGLVRQPAWKT